MKFRVSSALKNIIGRDLITDDFIAIFELVKNSYDAGAKKVIITFDEDKITVVDNGKGMSEYDIENKWLFVAYSAKKDGSEDFRDKAQQRRHYAGAKGIGRFSCDRLGNKLKMITRTANCKLANVLDVDWSSFEKNDKEEFIDIEIKHSKRKTAPIGTTLIIYDLPNDATWTKNKILRLRQSLEKLINPFEAFSKAHDFTIDVQCQHPELCGSITNQVFQKLNLKTTQIICEVNNSTITTELIDRGTPLYKIQEPNSSFKKLEQIKIQLFYLSPAAKNNFTRLMGVIPANFGSVFLFKNGFRVAPFGDKDDDSLKLDKRKAQGYARYIGSRELIGMIQVETQNEIDFKEASSRDSGLVNTLAYQQLIEAFYKTLKLLEKYVVDVTWLLEKGKKDTDDLKYIDTQAGKEKIVNMLSNLTQSENLSLLEFNKDFLNIISKRLNEQNYEILNKLHSLANKQGDVAFSNKIVDIQKKVVQLSREKQNAELNVVKADEARLEAEKNVQKERNEKEDAVAAYKAERKRGAFQGALIGSDKERIIGLQHQIFWSSSRVNQNLKLLLKHLDPNLIDTKTKKYIKVISLEASKINSIANFITKANFNLTAANDTRDIVEFITDYLNEIYIFKDRLIDIDMSIKIKNHDSIKYRRTFSPLEVTTIFDIIISNSEKAEAKNLSLVFSKQKERLVIDIKDDGSGISKKNINRVFELGFTTTSGSGIGLYQAYDLIVNNLRGEIKISSENKNGTSIQIIL